MTQEEHYAENEQMMALMEAVLSYPHIPATWRVVVHLVESYFGAEFIPIPDDGKPTLHLRLPHGWLEHVYPLGWTDYGGKSVFLLCADGWPDREGCDRMYRVQFVYADRLVCTSTTTAFLAVLGGVSCMGYSVWDAACGVKNKWKKALGVTT